MLAWIVYKCDNLQEEYSKQHDSNKDNSVNQVRYRQGRRGAYGTQESK